MTDDEIIAVVQAHKEGKQIEAEINGGWVEVRDPVWNFFNQKYRVKPEPRKPREWKICIHGDEMVSGLIRDRPGLKWVRVREVIEE